MKKFVLMALLSLIYLSTQAENRIRCEMALMPEMASPGQAIQRLSTKQEKIYPNVSGEEAGSHVMFGFESEYTTDQTQKILEVYRPKNFTNEQWKALSSEERFNWLKEALAKKRLGDKKSGLVIMEEKPELSFLPKEPIFDDTGNLELVVGPFDDYKTWKHAVTSINEMFGIGSQQAMVSVPKKFLFSPGEKQEEKYNEVMGVFNFLNQFDTLSRMKEGADRFQEGSDREVLKPFAHPYLGPMTKLKQDSLAQTMKQLSGGVDVYFDSVMVYSPKYTGSTAARPDIGRSVGRMGAEVRDAHNDEGKLISKTDRIAMILIGDRQPFHAYADVKSVDTAADFEKLSVTTQAVLKELFPARLDQTFNGGSPVERLALEVFRNFSYPLKDWTSDLKALKDESLEAKVKLAQEVYLAKVDEIAKNFRDGKLNGKLARASMEGACAVFSVTSGLYEAYEKAYQGAMAHSIQSMALGFEK